MIERVPCRECGSMILPLTAERNDGRCKPCAGGYRRQIEESRRLAEEDRRARNSPACRYWTALVRRVHDTPNGFDSLSEPEKTYYAVHVLLGAVPRGGFYHYFAAMAAHHAHALRGLREIGDAEAPGLVEAARRALFGEVEGGRGRLRGVLPGIDELEARRPDSLRRVEEIEKRFLARLDALHDLCDRFALQNALYADASPP